MPFEVKFTKNVSELAISLGSSLRLKMTYFKTQPMMSV